MAKIVLRHLREGMARQYVAALDCAIFALSQANCPVASEVLQDLRAELKAAMEHNS